MDKIEQLKVKRKIKDMMYGWEDKIQEFKQDLDNLFSNDKAKEYFIEQIFVVNDAFSRMNGCLYEQDRYFPIFRDDVKITDNDVKKADEFINNFDFNIIVDTDDESNNQS